MSMIDSRSGLMLSAPAVARELGIHRATLYRWIAAQPPIFPQPTLRRGRVVRWSREVVEQFAKTGSVQ